MQTLEKFIDERELSCDEFMARHKHPFLLIEADIQPDRKGFAVATQVVGPDTEIMKRIAALNQLEERGWKLEQKTLHYSLVAIEKKNINPFKSQISLGRTSLSDIVIPDSRISKRHAVFSYHEDNQQFTLSDLGSTNGTAINTNVLEPRKEYPLAYGDTIKLGQFSARFLNSCQVWNILQKALIKLS